MVDEMFNDLVENSEITSVANEDPTAKLSFAAIDEDHINTENGKMGAESADVGSAENIRRETTFPVSDNENLTKASFDDELRKPSKDLPCQTNSDDLASTHAAEDTAIPFLSTNDEFISAKHEGEVRQDEGGVEMLGVANPPANPIGVSDDNEVDGPSVVDMETE